MNLLFFFKQEFPKILRRYLPLFILAPIIAALTTYYITANGPTLFEATSKVLVGPQMNSANTDFDSLRIGSGLVQTYAELAETQPILQGASDQLNLGLTALQVDQFLEVRSNIDTRIITIIVRHEDPSTAVNIANNITESLVTLSASTQNTNQPTLENLQEDLLVVQHSITKTQDYITELEAELKDIQTQTKDISKEDIALIAQYQNIQSELSLERSRLSNALRTQGSNFGALNDNTFTTSPEITLMRENILSHLDTTEFLIEESIDRIARLEAELANMDIDSSTANYIVIIDLLNREEEIQGVLSNERVHIGDQTRTLALTIDVINSFNAAPNQVMIIEPAVDAYEIDNLLIIKVVSSGFAGLVSALVIIILIEILKMPQTFAAEAAGETPSEKEPKTEAQSRTKKAESQAKTKSGTGRSKK